MKKNLVVMLGISTMLMAGVVTGCGKTEAVAPTTSVSAEASTEAETSTSAETSSEAETSADAETTVSANADASSEYLSWTGKEWAAASDEEKEAVAKFYLLETIKLTAQAAGQEYTDEMEASITDEMVTANVPALDAAFQENADLKVQDFIDMATSLANEMVNAAESLEATTAAK